MEKRRGGAAHRRDRQVGSRVRIPAAGDSLRLPGLDSGNRHRAGALHAPRVPDQQQHARCLRCPEAPLPAPAHPLPSIELEERISPAASRISRRACVPSSWPSCTPCASWTCASSRRSPRPSTGPAACSSCMPRSSTGPGRSTLNVLLKFEQDIETARPSCRPCCAAPAEGTRRRLNAGQPAALCRDPAQPRAARLAGGNPRRRGGPGRRGLRDREPCATPSPDPGQVRARGAHLLLLLRPLFRPAAADFSDAAARYGQTSATGRPLQETAGPALRRPPKGPAPAVAGNPDARTDARRPRRIPGPGTPARGRPAAGAAGEPARHPERRAAPRRQAAGLERSACSRRRASTRGASSMPWASGAARCRGGTRARAARRRWTRCAATATCCASRSATTSSSSTCSRRGPQRTLHGRHAERGPACRTSTAATASASASRSGAWPAPRSRHSARRRPSSAVSCT
jgi:hypothetical protein